MAAWQNFYLLTGTAAATLIGLMFIAVTFGATRIKVQTTSTTRAFLDPVFTHFVTVLVVACVMVSPSASASFVGGLVAAIAVLRSWALVGIYRRMSEANRAHGDIELSDWLAGVVGPALCYLASVGVGAALIRGGYEAQALSALAIVVVAAMLLGIYGAWELMIWLAATGNAPPS